MADNLTAIADTAPENEAMLDEFEDASLAEEVRLLADEAKAYALAEVAFQKARAAYAARQARTIAMLGVAAAVLVFFAGMALVVGSIVALAPVIGGWGATGLVTLVLLVIAMVSLLTAKSRWSRTMATIGDEQAPGDAA